MRKSRVKSAVMLLLSSGALLALALVPLGNLRNGQIGPDIRPSSAHNKLENVPAASRFDEALIQSKTILLTEFNGLFENRLDWLAEDSSRVVFDVESRAGESPFVLVRVLVAQRAASRWSPIWQTDILCRNETFVDVAPEQLSGGAITLWVHTLADGQIFVESELTILHGTLQVAGGRVLQPGVPVRVECVQTSSDDLCVFQTVVPLDGLSHAT